MFFLFFLFLLLCFGAGFCLVLLENNHKGKIRNKKNKVNMLEEDSDSDDNIGTEEFNSKQLGKAARICFYMTIILGFLSWLTYALFYNVNKSQTVFSIPVILGIGSVICFMLSISFFFQSMDEAWMEKRAKKEMKFIEELERIDSTVTSIEETDKRKSYKFYNDKSIILRNLGICLLFVLGSCWLLYTGEEIVCGCLAIITFGLVSIIYVLMLISNKPRVEITPHYIKISNFEKLYWEDIKERRGLSLIVRDISKYRLTFTQRLNMRSGISPFSIDTMFLSEKDIKKLVGVLRVYIKNSK